MIYFDGSRSDLTFTCGVCWGESVDSPVAVCDLCEIELEETLDAI